MERLCLLIEMQKNLFINDIYIQIKPTPRKDLLDLSFAFPIFSNKKNQWSNNTWLENNEMDKYLLPYVLDIFKGNYDQVLKNNFIIKLDLLICI